MKPKPAKMKRLNKDLTKKLLFLFQIAKITRFSHNKIL